MPIIWTSGTRSELWSTWSCDRCHVSPRYNENATLPWPLPPSPREPQRHELPPQVAVPPAARRQVPAGQVLVSTTQILSLCKLSYVQTKLLVSGPVCTQSISNKPTLFPLNLFNRTRKHWHWIGLSKLNPDNKDLNKCHCFYFLLAFNYMMHLQSWPGPRIKVHHNICNVYNTCIITYIPYLRYADDNLNRVAAELDSFDGRKDPERCAALVSRLRSCQDKLLNICNRCDGDKHNICISPH